jgi:hypothetical protein
VPELV